MLRSPLLGFGAGLAETHDLGTAGGRRGGRVEPDRSAAGESVCAEPGREDQLLSSCGVALDGWRGGGQWQQVLAAMQSRRQRRRVVRGVHPVRERRVSSLTRAKSASV